MNLLGSGRVVWFAVSLALPMLRAQNAPPAVGDPAPEFQLSGSDGQEYALKQFVGKKPVVIAWFPKAFTGG